MFLIPKWRFMAVTMLSAACLSFFFTQRLYAESCEVGDESTGRWVRISNYNQAECTIPGPFDRIIGGGGSRIGGKYKIEAGIGGKGFYNYQPECEPECLKGFAEYYCKETYGWESDGQNCFMPDWNGDGTPDGYACFSDANHLTLYEWQWFSDDCDSPEEPNHDLGKPCPVVLVD